MTVTTPAPTTTPARRIPSLSIRYAIPGVLALLIIVAVGLTGYLAFRSGQQSVEDLAKKLISEKADRIDEHVRSFLEIPSLFNDINQAAYRSGNLDLTDYEHLRVYFWNMAHVSPGAPYLYYGTQASDFVGVDTDLNRTGKPAFKIRDETTNGERVTYWLNDKGNPTGEIESSRAYPTTERDWYKAAIVTGTSTWSPVYVFSAAKVLGISAVSPVYSTPGDLIGVLGIDLTLEELSDFLNEMEISPNGEAVIIEPDGNLVATSSDDPFYTVTQDSSGKDVQNRLSITDSASPIVKATGEKLKAQFGSFDAITDRQQITFDVNGKTQYVQISPITDDHGLDWLIIVIVPADDFMGLVYQNAQTTAILGGVVMVVAAVLGYSLASWIIRPVVIVSDVAKSIEKEIYELSPLSSVTPRTDELGQLARVFERMANEIYTRVEKLKEQVSMLRIEVDEAKKAKQVAEIVDSDFFSDLQNKAREVRQRKATGGTSTTTAPADKPKKKSK